jgi:hypothetical protein
MSASEREYASRTGERRRRYESEIGKMRGNGP